MHEIELRHIMKLELNALSSGLMYIMTSWSLRLLHIKNVQRDKVSVRILHTRACGTCVSF